MLQKLHIIRFILFILMAKTLYTLQVLLNETPGFILAISNKYNQFIDSAAFFNTCVKIHTHVFVCIDLATIVFQLQYFKCFNLLPLFLLHPIWFILFDTSTL